MLVTFHLKQVKLPLRQIPLWLAAACRLVTTPELVLRVRRQGIPNGLLKITACLDCVRLLGVAVAANLSRMTALLVAPPPFLFPHAPPHRWDRLPRSPIPGVFRIPLALV
jgi:hypothetical protein